MTNELISLFYDHGYHFNKHFCYSNLPIAACSERRSVTTIPLNGSVTRLTEGETFTFSCSAYGITITPGWLLWYFENLETGDADILFFDPYGVSMSRCLQTTSFTLTNVNKNNIGNYSCRYRYIDFEYDDYDPTSVFFIDVGSGW